MSIIMALGWVILGAVVAGAIGVFWDDIKSWLNNVAADFVEEHLGYSARERMQKAIVKVDKVLNKVRNKSVIYTKKNELDNYFDKTTIISECDVHEISDEVLNEIKQKGELLQTYEYKQ